MKIKIGDAVIFKWLNCDKIIKGVVTNCYKKDYAKQIEENHKELTELLNKNADNNMSIFTEATKSCTCGISAIGGGIHSDWCDLYEVTSG